MKFRTEYTPVKADFILDPSRPVVLAGSCFSQNIARKMQICGWTAVIPGGTLYNPSSIATAVELFADVDNGISRFEDSLFQYNGLWNSSLFDSSFSAFDPADSIAEFKERQKLFLESIEEGETLIVTFGTSIAYRYLTTGQVVGNCHKLPSQYFEVFRLTQQEIILSWTTLLQNLRKRWPGLKIIFTVSPVRHLKNGFTGNSCSKALLLLAVESICTSQPGCSYFPSFEIMNDDLRDYRFYASDMVHPSEEAVEYIWDIFKSTYLNEEGLSLLDKGLKEQLRKLHRAKTGALGKPLSKEKDAHP